jgi:hypothetical protein
MKILIKTNNFSYKENSFEISITLIKLDLEYTVYIEENSINHIDSKTFYYETNNIETFMSKLISYETTKLIDDEILKTLRSYKIK